MIFLKKLWKLCLFYCFRRVGLAVLSGFFSSVLSHQIYRTFHLDVSTEKNYFRNQTSDEINLRHGVQSCPPGARFTNEFLPEIQIRWKIHLAVILLLAIRSQQIFAHATTAQLSCHVQNFVAITVLEFRWQLNEISIEFELRWKNR